MTIHRWLLVTLMMTCSLFACATERQTKLWTFGDTLKAMERATTEQELLAAIGPPHGNALFNPGSSGDPSLMNSGSRKSLKETEVYVPVSLVDQLPPGTRVLAYNFHYGAALVGGELDIYVDKGGKILGYSYTKTLTGLETKARMTRRP